ncbi:dihydrolipoyl dehydrogenase [Candidatus Bipolaricaulota bacterium]|nr:dihydrolipoyl dehydrogenase [Candidatus Bipolaricaulota bacterium]
MFDVAIIGAGPGGYVTAIRTAQLGFKTVVIEEGELGGVCLNRGCIPTKALCAATELLHEIDRAAEIGIHTGKIELDLHRLAAWKEEVVTSLVTGIKLLFKSHGVALVNGRGRLVGHGRIAVTNNDEIAAERIVLAAGSAPLEIPNFSFADDNIWSSDDALRLTEIPNHLVVIGGGVIGLELATVYRRLGSEITVVEMMPDILPGIEIDRRALSVLKRALTAQGITIHTNTAAKSYRITDEGIILQAAGRDGVLEIEASKILLAVGRRPRSDDLGLETIGLAPNAQRFIEIGPGMETTVAGVYAIGDLVPGPMLAHKASAEGLLFAESLQGKGRSLNYDKIPQAIFTDPQIASAGISERTAKEKGYDIIVGRFPYAALGKARGMRKTEGFFQVIADQRDHLLLGVQIVGAEAANLISEAALAIEAGLPLEAIGETVHPHPTLSEGLLEAAENAIGKAIHVANR